MPTRRAFFSTTATVVAATALSGIFVNGGSLTAGATETTDPTFVSWTDILPSLTSGFDPTSENECVAGKINCVDKAIREMRRVLQPGGRLALSAYQAVPFLPREGRHSGEIYFYRFTRGDLLQLLEPHFRIVRLTGTGYVWVVSARAT